MYSLTRFDCIYWSMVDMVRHQQVMLSGTGNVDGCPRGFICLIFSSLTRLEYTKKHLVNIYLINKSILYTV